MDKLELNNALGGQKRSLRITLYYISRQPCRFWKGQNVDKEEKEKNVTGTIQVAVLRLFYQTELPLDDRPLVREEKTAPNVMMDLTGDKQPHTSAKRKKMHGASQTFSPHVVSVATKRVKSTGNYRPAHICESIRTNNDRH